jgi:putative transposase
MRKTMVEKDHPQLSIRQQCELLEVNRNRLEVKPRKPSWEPAPEDFETMELMRLIHAKDPTFGTRRMRQVLLRNGYRETRWKVRQMMRYLGLKAIFGKPRTTIAAADHPKYPYLLRDIEVTLPDEVWATDITYIPWNRGFVYLTCVMDWKTRAILSWKLSNTMDVSFCLDALGEAVASAGCAPQIFNTDQGSQFTGVEWLSAVESLGATVSMDGKGRWQDNVLIERFWRSVKHEWILLHDCETLPELEALLAEWIERYNQWRPHTANDGQTPWEAYRGSAPVLERDQMGRGGGAREIGRDSAAAESRPISRLAA